jgi:multisubunit Na+/H+ antiporter MnhG subunit
MFLGEDLLAWLVLAIGGAMAAGSIMALVRPPDSPREGDLATAPVGRSVVMIVVGAIAAIWALASLVAG